MKEGRKKMDGKEGRREKKKKRRERDRRKDKMILWNRSRKGI